MSEQTSLTFSELLEKWEHHEDCSPFIIEDLKPILARLEALAEDMQERELEQSFLLAELRDILGKKTP